MSERQFIRNVEEPLPEQGEVHLWHFNHLDYEAHQIAELSDVLTSGEQERAGRFHFEKDRRQFSVARSCLRILLGSYLGEEPDMIQIEIGSFGKPFVKSPSNIIAGEFYFNVAHSAEHILIAFSSTAEIGVDIEALRLNESRMEPLIQKICTARERDWIASLNSSDVELALTRLWTAKEAALKAVGSGFQIPPDQVEVAREIFSGGEQFSTATSSSFAQWQAETVLIYPMAEFEDEQSCSAALAVKGDLRSIRIRRRKDCFLK